MLVAVLLAIAAIAAVWYLTRDRAVNEPAQTTEAPEAAPVDPLEDAAESVGEAAESAGDAVQEAVEGAAETVGDAVDPDGE
jgi:hypothetical protein